MLLEALIAILIFSLSLMAMIGMQAVALRNVGEAKYRMDATFLANQIISQMWVDRANLAAYAYDGGAPSAALADWIAQVNQLPGASDNPPSIEIGAGSQVTVTVYWQHPDQANQVPKPPPHSFIATGYINCC
jgi:type IV pilus assembly protein PilV